MQQLSFQQLFSALLVLFGVLFGASALFAWTAPDGTPPQNNVDGPLNIGTSDQVKNGGIGVNALLVFGNTLLSGGAVTYANYGDTSGADGYGFRDNDGTMEYKDEDGSWVAFSSIEPPEPDYLYNAEHTYEQCTEDAGGSVVSTDDGALCEIVGTSCPSGWTQLNSWSSTESNSCSGGGCGGTSCTTGAHAFADTARETCSYSSGGSQSTTCNKWGCTTGSCQGASSYTCYADVTTVGCY